jgi:hypothetical protein
VYLVREEQHALTTATLLAAAAAVVVEPCRTPRTLLHWLEPDL